LQRQKKLLLTDRPAEVAQQITVAGTDILEGVTPIQMLRSSREIDPLGAVAVVTEIIGIVIVEHRVQYVEVDAAQSVHHANQAIQADPGVVMDGDLEGFLDRRARERGSALRISKVDFGVAVPGNLDPEISWERKKGDLVTS